MAVPVVVQTPAPAQQTGQNLSIPFPNPVTANNLLVLQISWPVTAGTVSPADNLNSSWRQFDGYAASSRAYYVFGAIAGNTGPCTILVSSDASRTYSYAIYEVKTALASLDGAPLHTNAASGTNASSGTLQTRLPNSILFSVVKPAAGGVTAVPSAPWVAQTSGAFGSAYQIATVPGNYTANWTVASGIWATGILAFIAKPDTATSVGDTEYSLLAKANKASGGTGTTPSDTEFTMLAKQLRLLGGSPAQANTNIFVLLARINKQLGGTGTTPSDNVFTLLAKQNRLLGGAGATASDTVFTLLAKNSKLFHQ